MKNVYGKVWRNSASLIMLNKRSADLLSCRNSAVNYDVLLQTRTGTASFPNSVVFPGGVTEAADENTDWFNLLKEFGYTQNDFDALHRPNTLVTSIFQPDPVKRHVSLRITAIRETFEELGILLCSRKAKGNRHSLGADIINDIDLKYWQKEISSNPESLLSLCKEYKCYPDIWSLYYWSNWLSPAYLPKRFSTAFFVTEIGDDKPDLVSNSEVTNVQWANPEEILEKNIRNKLLLYPPQVYELNRLTHFKDIEKLIQYAKLRSCDGSELLFPVIVLVKDGIVQVLPGDDLYPANVNLQDPGTINHSDKTILELRNCCDKLHRLEVITGDSNTTFVLHNYHPTNHINMGEKVFTGQATIRLNLN